jgi:predicted MPP superfamily phosphohydrolase
MVQFTDIHFGEDEPDDLDNMRLISDILEQEKPDLAVITGDVVSGYAWD